MQAHLSLQSASHGKDEEEKDGEGVKGDPKDQCLQI